MPPLLIDGDCKGVLVEESEGFSKGGGEDKGSLEGGKYESSGTEALAPSSASIIALAAAAKVFFPGDDNDDDDKDDDKEGVSEEPAPAEVFKPLRRSFIEVLPVNLPLPAPVAVIPSLSPPLFLLLQKQSSAYAKSLLKAPKSASREVRDTNSVVALTFKAAVVMEYTESSTNTTRTSTA
jgi:hypothetical protein